QVIVIVYEFVTDCVVGIFSILDEPTESTIGNAVGKVARVREVNDNISTLGGDEFLALRSNVVFDEVRVGNANSVREEQHTHPILITVNRQEQVVKNIRLIRKILCVTLFNDELIKNHGINIRE